MNIVELSQIAAQPWRNGGGQTRELLAWPGAHDWSVRVSVATIAHSGAFSAFADVDRWFAVIEGAGVRLDLPGGARTCTPGDAPLRFDGEAAPMCHLLDGATTDLNLMARRGAGHGGQSRMRTARVGEDGARTGRWRGLFVACHAVLDVDGVAWPLKSGSLLWSDQIDSAPWQLRQLDHADRAWWLTLDAA